MSETLVKSRHQLNNIIKKVQNVIEKLRQEPSMSNNCLLHVMAGLAMFDYRREHQIQMNRSMISLHGHNFSGIVVLFDRARTHRRSRRREFLAKIPDDNFFIVRCRYDPQRVGAQSVDLTGVLVELVHFAFTKT